MIRTAQNDSEMLGEALERSLDRLLPTIVAVVAKGLLPKKSYTVKEAATSTGVLEGTIAAAIRRGDLRAKQTGRGNPYIILGRDLKDWLSRLAAVPIRLPKRTPR